VTENLTPNGASISRGHLALLLVTAAMTTLLIILGSVVCIADASAACPDWPGCYGRAVPPLEIKAILEYTHRLVAGLTTPLIVAAAIVGWRRARHLPWVSRPPLLAIIFVLAVIVFGALVVLRGLPRGAAAADLGSALIVLALMVTATLAAYVQARRPGPALHLSWRTPLGELSLAALVAVYLVLVGSVLVAEPGSVVRCLSWPSYRMPGTAHVTRSVLAGVASLLVLGVAAAAWRARNRRPALAPTALAAGLLLISATLLPLLRPLDPAAAVTGTGAALSILSSAAAALLWAFVVALALLSGLPPSRRTGG
jgi:cytochrome c oxidase assembly protein subunit 15